MRKVEILLNEKKIKLEGKYSLEKIYKTLDESFINDAFMDKHWVEPDGTRVYVATKLKNKDHHAMIMSEVGDYMEEAWFRDNVLKYVYGNSHESDNISDFTYEDVLKAWGVGKSVA